MADPCFPPTSDFYKLDADLQKTVEYVFDIVDSPFYDDEALKVAGLITAYHDAKRQGLPLLLETLE